MNAVVRSGVAASNELTSRWIGSVGAKSGNFVLSGVAVWPLLAALASGADGAVREGLERALGLPSADALGEALRMLDWLERESDTNAALGIWVRDDVSIKRRWRKGLPAGILGRLSGDPDRDQAAVDAWVRDQTHQIIARMPVQVRADTLLLLAQAMALRTRWSNPFDDFRWEPGAGPWSGRELNGLRATSDPGQVLVLDTGAGPVTTFRCDGTGRVDVWLVLGDEEQTPANVLIESIGRLPGPRVGRSGSDLQVGETAPGLVMLEEQVEGWPAGLRVRTVRFGLESRHDLLDASGVFGLEAAARDTDFTGISDVGLIVNQAVQSARARFTASGFEAAAVTAFAMHTGISDHVRRKVKVLEVSFDRPFGFIALDRMSRLVLFAGWVEDPEPWSPDVASTQPRRLGLI